MSVQRVRASMLSRLAQGLLQNGRCSTGHSNIRALSGLAFQKVERVAWDSKADAEQQQKEIMEREEPLIITGSIDSWPIRSYNLDSMRKEFGDIVVRPSGLYPDSLRVTVQLPNIARLSSGLLLF